MRLDKARSTMDQLDTISIGLIGLAIAMGIAFYAIRKEFATLRILLQEQQSQLPSSTQPQDQTSEDD